MKLTPRRHASSLQNLELLEPRRLMTLVSVPFALDFSGDAGGLGDAGGTGTGFTRTQVNRGSPFDYDASLLGVAGGRLTITSAAGNDGTNSGSLNTLVNALQVGFDARDAFVVQTRVVPAAGDANLGQLDARFEQAGILIGGDADRWVKLVAIHHVDGSRIQFAGEFPDGMGGFTTGVSVPDGLVSAGGWSTVTSLDLRVQGDPQAGTLSASYRVNNGVWHTVPFEVTVPVAQRAAFFAADTGAGVVAFHRNTDAVRGLSVAFEHFDIARPAPAAVGRPSVTAVRPAANTQNVRRDAFIAFDVNLPAGALDPSTIGASSVFLVDSQSGQAVPARATVSGGGDAITLTPIGLLAANRGYTFHVTDAVRDVDGNMFVPFSASFTTGTAVAESLPHVAFTQTPQAGTAGLSWTGLAFGPDGRLYGVTADGKIQRFDVLPGGNLSSGTLLTTLTEADGTTPRLITGLAFDTSAAGLTAYVSHGAYVDPANDSDRNAPEWSGSITRLTGANLQNRLDVVVGLPRSVYDHLNNQPVFGPDGRLYVMVASNTAMGAPDTTWGMRPEQLLSASVLAMDVRAITSTLDVKTADGGTYDPFAPGAPVTIFATGIRNAYDLVWTAGGHLFAPANGSAAGGAAPASPDGTVPGIARVNETQLDLLYRVEQGAYYGHPNPVRGQYVLGGGNPTAGQDPNQVSQYPVGTQPDPDYRGFAFDFGLNVSPNGVLQYDSGGMHFGGALDGMLAVVRFSGGDDVMFLKIDEATGEVRRGFAGSFGTGGLSDPLDVVQDPATGNLYVIEAGFRTSGGNLQITLLTPVQAAPLLVTAPTRDYGNGPTLHLNAVAGSTNQNPVTVSLGHGGGPGMVAFPADAAIIRGPDAQRFRIVSGDPADTSLTAGQSRNLVIAFEPNAVRLFSAELVLKSNDPAAPERVIPLRGLGTAGTGGNLEPSLQRLLDLYGLQVNVGDPDPTTTAYPSAVVVPGSDEVTAQLLRRAGSGPVTVEILGSFGTANANAFTNTSGLGWYVSGTHGSPTQLFTVSKSQAQAVQVTPSGTLSFTPADGQNFGLVGTFFDFGPRQVFQQDHLNTWESDANKRRKVRLFPLKDTNGQIVADAYVFAFEEWDQATDQNDLVGIIRNVRVAGSEHDIRLVNAEHAIFGDRLIMSRVQRPDHVVGNGVRDEATLVVTNEGTQPLQILGVSVSNNEFTVLSGGQAGTLAPGASRQIRVRFVYSNTTDFGVGPGNQPRSPTLYSRTADLIIATDDAAAPNKIAKLAGLWQSHSEEGGTGTSQEPNLNEIVRAFGWAIDVGPDTGLGNFDTGQNTNGARIAVGEEVLSDYWFGVNGPVEAIQLAAYHQQRDPEFNGSNTPRYIPNTSFRWHFDGSFQYNQIFKHHAHYGQSLLPLIEHGTTLARGTFNPGSQKFAVSVDQTWHSDHTRNGGQAHGFRFYAVKDANGVIIPNVYLAAEDNVGASFANFDYQDNVYLLLGVRPAVGPRALGGLTAAGTSAGISLQWNASPEGNVTTYRVLRSTSANGTFAELATVATNDYVDTSAAPNTTFFYRVVAYDYHGTAGATGTTASATRPDGPAAPPAPANLTANADGPRNVTLAWSDVAGETGYRVLRSAGGTFSTLATLPANATTFTDATAAGGTAYTYRVVAFNAAGDSAPASVSVTTPPDLAAPLAVTATATAHNRVVVTWADASGNETGFRVERSTAGGTFVAVGTVGANAESFTDTTASASTTYAYRVVTLGPSGTTGGSSAAVTVTTPADPTQVAAVTGLAVGSLSWNSVALTWEHTGTNLTGFEVTRDGVAVKTLGAAARGWTDSGVQAERSYTYAVRAINVVAGETYRSPAVTLAVTTPRNPADLIAPPNLAAVAVTRSQVDLTWQAVPSATFFVVQRRPAGDGEWQTLASSVPASQLDYVDNTAPAGASLEYRVRARNAFNTDAGPWSTVSVSTPAADALVLRELGVATGTLTGTPASFTLTATGTSDQTDLGSDDDIAFAGRTFVGDFDVVIRLNGLDKASPATAAGLMARDDLSPGARNVFLRFSGDIALSWRDTPDAETRPPAGTRPSQTPVFLRLVRTGDTFAGFVSDDGVAWTAVATSSTIVMGATVHVGAAVASYSPLVSTATFAGFGVYAAQPPLAPVALGATIAGGVRLSWQDVSSNEDGFRVERSPVSGSAWVTLATLDAGTTAYIDASATPGGVFRYRVVAFNDAGEAASAPVEVAVPDNRPPAPGNGTPPLVRLPDASPVRPALPAGNSIRWQHSEGDANGYVLQRRLPGGTWADVTRVGSAASGVRDATATPGVTYEYRVAAFNDDGLGAATEPVTVATPAAAATRVATPRLTWTPVGVVIDLDNVVPADVERRIDGGGWVALARDVTGRHVDATPPYGRTFEYRARPAGSNVAWSHAALLRPADATPVTTTAGVIGDARGTVNVVRDFVHLDARVTGGAAWGFEDGVVFHGQALTGDFDVAVRVSSNGGHGSSAGLMVRASNDPSAVNAFVSRTSSGVTLTHRRSPSGMTATAGTEVTSADWLRLARRGDTVYALAGTDGTTWQRVGQVNLERLGRGVIVGVAAAGGQTTPDAPVDVRFREFRHLAGGTGPTSLTADRTSTGVTLAWPVRGPSLWYTVERRDATGLWHTLARVQQDGYVDTSVVPGVGYAYRIAAEDGRASASARVGG